MSTSYKWSHAFATVICFLAAWAILFSHTAVTADDGSDAQSVWVYIAADGIRHYRMDLDDGALSAVSETQEAKPSFLAIHPSGRFLYGAGGELSGFSIDASSGRLTILSKVPLGREGLCHLVVDRDGSNVLGASYGAGVVSVHRIGQGGRPGKRTARAEHKGSSVNQRRQQAPHAHSINLDANNRFAFAADLGIDKIVVYQFDASHGTLDPSAERTVSLKPGAGPRHFAFHPSGRFAYVINELDSTIVAFRYDAAAGQLAEIETVSTLPADFEGENSTAEVVVDPSGCFLYGSNRGHDSIAVFAVDAANGNLKFVEHASTGGSWPRNFCIDPSGKFLLAANQKSDNVVVFRIDGQTGTLTRTPHAIEAPGPACIRFLPH